MNEIFIEAESLRDLGGWVIDTASVDVLGSAYIMAHGMGIPVADAVGSFEAPADALYKVYALTRDWSAVWEPSAKIGKFELHIDGVKMPNILGTESADWAWQRAGEVYLSKGTHTVAFHDLTGFNGRCDALYLTDGDSALDGERSKINALRRRLTDSAVGDEETEYDLAVVGGGIAGICTAVSAMLSGVSVALIHDREVLGGCNSSEVRVCMGGLINLPPYPELGNIVKAIAPICGYPSVYGKEYFEDNRKHMAFEIKEPGIAKHKLYLNESVTDVEMSDGAVTAVICTNVRLGKRTRIRAKMFADCSGDGIIARKSGCEVMYGRDARGEFGESLAPETHENLVMGQSIRWYSEKSTAPVPFPDIDLGLHFTDETCLNCTSGDWEQETGFTRDMVNETEYIRDYGLRAIYSNWSYQKNHHSDREKFAFLELKWVSPIGGKRESIRVKGDHILTQNDIEAPVMYEDGTASITWSIDMHFPEPANAAAFGEAFRSFAYHRGVVAPYPVPYRCLYSKDVKNLFIGGRLVSASHVAFSAVRVMRTLGELGEVVGIASSVCKDFGCTPREVYAEHLDELKARLAKGVRYPDAFGCAVGSEEAYHFKDIGWWWLDRKTAHHPEEAEKFKNGVKALGLSHKYPMPDEWRKV